MPSRVPRRIPSRRKLTHLDSMGRARMVDVGGKPVTLREATALGEIRMAPGTVRKIVAGKVPKGDVLAAARIAGILAAKRVDELIPLCHGLSLDAVEIGLAPGEGVIRVRAKARTHGKTGVEMEALLAAAVACLTIYDMAKSLDRGMTIGPIYLAEKKGGRSGHYVRSE